MPVTRSNLKRQLQSKAVTDSNSATPSKKKKVEPLEKRTKQGKQPDTVTLVHSFPEDKPVRALTTLDNELYVRYVYQPIAVYDKEMFSLLRRLSLEGLGVKDMASCERFQCIYISDGTNKVIHRVEKANNKHTTWSVDDEPSDLSVNSEHNVIVTFNEVHKVKVFTTHGELMKEINLQQTGIKYPWHTIQLSTDKYVVSHGWGNYTLHRVVVVDGSGRIEHTFGKERGSNDDQFDLPGRLAVVKNGFILVADIDNRRLVMLSPTLCYVKSWKLTAEPLGMWFDEETDKLYVAVNKEWNKRSEEYASGHIEVYSVGL